MAAPTLTVQLPDPLYARLVEPHRSNRPVEAEVVTVLESAVNGDEGLSADLAAEMASMEGLTDDDLWRAARIRLADELAERSEELHFKRQSGGLSAAEANESTGLVRQYERIMLLRAQAACLLKARGHNVGGLLGS